MTRDALRRTLDALLQPRAFTDVAENGLQIEGASEVRRVVCGVTANAALIDRALELGAHAIVVHHGLVWGGGLRRIDGWLAARMRRLMKHDVSLFAYHLPLDAHPVVGNNAGLARALGLVEVEPFGRYKGQLIGLRGRLPEKLTAQRFGDRVAGEVGPLHPASTLPRDVEMVGVCSGGAPDLLQEAIDAGLDAYVTGEPTEWSRAVAEEAGVGFVAAGHHATERFGPRALAEHLRVLGWDAVFVDVPNPV